MIIGVSGKARAGKTTTAGYILEYVPGAEEVPFAKKLKESFAALFGIPPEWLDVLKTGRSKIKIAPDPDLDLGMIEDLWDAELDFRQALQRYGTECHREIFGDDFWIEQVLRADDHEHLIVIPDVRFPNELEAVRQRDGYLIKVFRDGVNLTDGHPSEQDLPDAEFDYLLDNNGSFEDLRLQVVTILTLLQPVERI